MNTFTISHKSSTSRARRGLIKSEHGDVETPAFVTVGTKATIKSLAPEDLSTIGTQFVFCNTYHLVLSPGLEFIKNAGGVHVLSKLNRPIITDSGGFQVFSLGKGPKVSLNPGEGEEMESSHLVKITDDGVNFRSHRDGVEYFFTPEFSIQAQQAIGADFIVAFDECLGIGATHKQTLASLARTHDWARRSYDESKTKNAIIDQGLYGVIQGGMYEDLRKKSAEYTASIPFWGLAIGGVSVGETAQEMKSVVSWVSDVIHEDMRARHLLGVSTIAEVLHGVRSGVDTFDCVLPTRDARIGHIYTLDAKKSIDDCFQKNKIKTYKNSLEPLDESCSCSVCTTYTAGYVFHLFQERELLYYRLATIHNLHVMEQFFKRIRKEIEEGTL